MRLSILIIVIVLALLPPFCDLVFTDEATQFVGSAAGEGEAVPLTDTTDGAARIGGGLTFPSAEAAPRLTDYPAVVFIVSTETGDDTSAMNTAAILCYTVPMGDGVFSWQGTAKGWASCDNLLYTLHAIGDADGLTSVTAEQYLLGEKSDTPVYVRQVVGVDI